MSCDDCSPAVEYQIEKAIQHEKYENTEKYDIGLLKLVEEVKFTDQIKPICLPLKEENYFNSKEVLTIMGFGKNINGNWSSVLMKANVPFVPLDVCEKLYKKSSIGNFDEGSFCAGDETNNACRGTFI